MPFGWLLLAAALLIQQPATPADTSPMDYDVYRTQIEPIFFKTRAPNKGSDNACVLCHTTMATRMRLQPLPAGATAWTEEQSRRNFVAHFYRLPVESRRSCLPSSVMSQPRPRFRSSVSYTDSLPKALDTRVETTAATISGSAMG